MKSALLQIWPKIKINVKKHLEAFRLVSNISWSYFYFLILNYYLLGRCLLDHVLCYIQQNN